MAKLRTPDYDISGNTITRVLRFNLLNKIVPIGNYRLGTGLKPGLVLLVLHWFGRPLFRLLIRYEPFLHRIYQRLRKN